MTLVPSEAANDAAVRAPVSFACAACGKKLKAKVELAGKKVRCSQCNQAVQVPKPNAGEVERRPL
jgi:DNA-directed RNA polymerase subunit RPC12/RpoP